MHSHQWDDREAQLQRLGHDMTADRVDVPYRHRPRVHALQQAEDDLLIYEKGNEKAQILVEENVADTVVDVRGNV